MMRRLPSGPASCRPVPRAGGGGGGGGVTDVDARPSGCADRQARGARQWHRGPLGGAHGMDPAGRISMRLTKRSAGGSWQAAAGIWRACAHDRRPRLNRASWHHAAILSFSAAAGCGLCGLNGGRILVLRLAHRVGGTLLQPAAVRAPGGVLCLGQACARVDPAAICGSRAAPRTPRRPDCAAWQTSCRPGAADHALPRSPLPACTTRHAVITELPCREPACDERRPAAPACAADAANSGALPHAAWPVVAARPCRPPPARPPAYSARTPTRMRLAGFRAACLAAPFHARASLARANVHAVAFMPFFAGRCGWRSAPCRLL